MSREPRPLFDELLDVALYAPIGLVSKVLEQIPGLVAEGRARIGGQVDQARVIGRFAVGVARSKTLRSFVGKPAASSRRPQPTREPGPREPSSPQASARTATSGGQQPHKEDRQAPSEGPPPPPQAIADYDALSASQVVPRLHGLDRDELDAIARYEAATRGRRTILNRVAQLQRALDER
jgi:hypothetical protein